MPIRLNDLNKCCVEAEYAVRGVVPTMAVGIERELHDPATAGKYNFNKIIYCNIGNPQKLGQKPLTFVREALALVLNPRLLEEHDDFFDPESVKCARRLLASEPAFSEFDYTEPSGSAFVRQSVCDFVKERDMFKEDAVSADDVILTNGASTAINIMLSGLCEDAEPRKVGFLVPVPQYPLYSAVITCLGANIIPYSLDEDARWSINLEALEKEVVAAQSRGITIKGLVVINPGNPTGSVLDETVIAKLVSFAAHHGIVILADEVYQNNIYAPDKHFSSFQSVAAAFHAEHPQEPLPRVVSFHSVSKGVTGECGLRGGYAIMSGFPKDDSVKKNFMRFTQQAISPNIVGQVAVYTMVAPPKQGSGLRAVHDHEKQLIFDSLARRARMATERLTNEELRISCPHVDGALYAFPNMKLPQRFIDEAKSLGRSPDLHYCMLLVQQTGVVVVNGSGFLQKEGTYHFRTTILPQEDVYNEFLNTFIEFHKHIMREYGE